jgi:hypothetical protein
MGLSKCVPSLPPSQVLEAKRKQQEEVAQQAAKARLAAAEQRAAAVRQMHSAYPPPMRPGGMAPMLPKAYMFRDADAMRRAQIQHAMAARKSQGD